MKLRVFLFAMMTILVQCIAGQSAQNEASAPPASPAVITVRDEHITLTVDRVIKAETLQAKTLALKEARAEQLEKQYKLKRGRIYVAIQVIFRKIEGVHVEGPTKTSILI